jgi:two-component system response regulator HydG
MGSRIHIVVVDDDPRARTVLRRALSHRTFDLTVLGDGRAVLEYVTRHVADVLIADVTMPGVNGLELLTAIKNHDPLIEVLLLSRKASVEQAVSAVKRGALDYLTKPLDQAKLLGILGEITTQRALRSHVGVLQRQLETAHQFHGMVGRNPRMLEVFSLVRRLATHFRTLVITGETGTGKEMIARALHTLSPRAAAPFIPWNCAAMTETLAESELFGHERGAFTGALRTKRGLFEAAKGGTIFLDEVSEMSSTLQPKLLRVLESGEIQRVGSPTSIMLDVRVIAATNRRLREWVTDGRFRQDLYHRLNTIEIHLPALRDRKDDVPLLCQHFLTILNGRTGKHVKGLSRQAQVALFQHDWPGNVRELARTLEHAVLLTQGTFIGMKDLPPSFQREPRISPASVTKRGR